MTKILQKILLSTALLTAPAFATIDSIDMSIDYTNGTITLNEDFHLLYKNTVKDRKYQITAFKSDLTKHTYKQCHSHIVKPEKNTDEFLSAAFKNQNPYVFSKVILCKEKNNDSFVLFLNVYSPNINDNQNTKNFQIGLMYQQNTNGKALVDFNTDIVSDFKLNNNTGELLLP